MPTRRQLLALLTAVGATGLVAACDSDGSADGDPTDETSTTDDTDTTEESDPAAGEPEEWAESGGTAVSAISAAPMIPLVGKPFSFLGQGVELTTTLESVDLVDAEDDNDGQAQQGYRMGWQAESAKGEVPAIGGTGILSSRRVKDGGLHESKPMRSTTPTGRAEPDPGDLRPGTPASWTSRYEYYTGNEKDVLGLLPPTTAPGLPAMTYHLRATDGADVLAPLAQACSADRQKIPLITDNLLGTIRVARAQLVPGFDGWTPERGSYLQLELELAVHRDLQRNGMIEAGLGELLVELPDGPGESQDRVVDTANWTSGLTGTFVEARFESDLEPDGADLETASAARQIVVFDVPEAEEYTLHLAACLDRDSAVVQPITLTR